MFRDMIDASSVRVVNSFPDAMSWPITVGITGIDLKEGRGVVPMVKGLERWPDFRKPGWDGDLRFTLWAGFKIDGQWFMSGFMQFWKDRRDTGAHPLEIDPAKGINQWQANWAYGGWGPLDSYVPTQGTLMALMVTHGDARFAGQRELAERSQIVTVPLNPTGSWAFLESDDQPQPQPAPAPVPGPPSDGMTELDWIKTTRDEIILTKQALETERELARSRHQELVVMLNSAQPDDLLTKVWEQLRRGFTSRYIGDIKPKD